MAAITSAVIGALAVGAGIYQAKRSKDQAKRAEDSAERQALRQQMSLQETEKKESERKRRDELRLRQRGMVAGAFGRRGTVATSALGLPGAPGTVQTKLGGGA